MCIFHFIQTNTYQAVAITDGADSYAVFIYHCHLLQWTGLWSQPVIGFNAATGSLYSNHPYSFLSNANEIACISDDYGSNFTSVIFKISSVPDPVQSQRQSCWRWYFNDLSIELINIYSRFAPPCPCTEYQASLDSRWNFYFRSSLRICYISEILTLQLGQLCCYYSLPEFREINGAPIVTGRYSGGFLLHHPHADYNNYIIEDYRSKQLCCSIGMCSIFGQKRPLQTCEGYQLQLLGKLHNFLHDICIPSRNMQPKLKRMTSYS